MNSTGFAMFLLVLLASSPAVVAEVFHWVDENGVSHYTQSAPPSDVEGVSQVILEDTRSSDYDPDEDRYGIKAQAERMASLREELKENREAQRERQRNAAAQQPVQYRDPYPYGRSMFWQPPYYPRPPVRPELPIAVPYETATLRPPGR